MLNRYARAVATKIFTPVALLFLRLGLTPDAVTILGTLGVIASALVFYPMGELFWGSVGVAFFVLSDTVDGIMARTLGRSGKWGAYLDSTLDRFGDSAVFAGLAIWFARGGDDELTAGLALLCLVLGSLVSYAKARAEGLGYTVTSASPDAPTGWSRSSSGPASSVSASRCPSCRSSWACSPSPAW